MASLVVALRLALGTVRSVQTLTVEDGQPNMSGLFGRGSVELVQRCELSVGVSRGALVDKSMKLLRLLLVVDSCCRVVGIGRVVHRDIDLRQLLGCCGCFGCLVLQ